MQRQAPKHQLLLTVRGYVRDDRQAITAKLELRFRLLSPASPSSIEKVSRQAPLRHGPGRAAASPRVPLSVVAVPVHAGGVCICVDVFCVCVCVCPWYVRLCLPMKCMCSCDPMGCACVVVRVPMILCCVLFMIYVLCVLSKICAFFLRLFCVCVSFVFFFACVPCQLRLCVSTICMCFCVFVHDLGVFVFLSMICVRVVWAFVSVLWAFFGACMFLCLYP